VHAPPREEAGLPAGADLVELVHGLRSVEQAVLQAHGDVAVGLVLGARQRGQQPHHLLVERHGVHQVRIALGRHQPVDGREHEVEREHVHGVDQRPCPVRPRAAAAGVEAEEAGVWGRGDDTYMR